ncbi:hypothetical protein [Paenibacillus sp. N3.4]|uniref:hypothetical protein n=1 Tax=Paenibacillus sp. N3.4 TaxID=2603222 RepID=UPI0011CB1FC3|nr:hypothetical protein [Paenibacillus sp. N3.4]TXK82542.1 hypothetical protein FU659_15250 [Paenibacillus sp. N3.4]
MWFQKKSPPPSPPIAKQQPAPSLPKDPSVRQLELRLLKLEEHLADLVAKRPDIYIDSLHIHQPVLENLTFRLDQLDIKELSGSLNLGNNFGAKQEGKHDEVNEAFIKADISKPAPPSGETTTTGKAGSHGTSTLKTDSQDNTPKHAHTFSKSDATSSRAQPARPQWDAAESKPSIPHTERTATGYRYIPHPKSTGGT